MQDVTKNAFLNKEQSRELINKYQKDNCEESFNLLLESHIALLKNMVKKELVKVSDDKDVSYQDCLQEAIFYFIKCIRNYDLESDASLVTYLCSCIPGYLKKYIYSMEVGPLDLRKKAYINYIKASTFEEEYFKKHNKLPSDELIVEHSQVSIKNYRKQKSYFSGYRNMKSMNEIGYSKGDNKAIEFHEMLQDNKTDIEQQTETKLLVQECFRHIKNEKDKKILYMYFFEEKTQPQIAEILGTNQVYISRSIRKSFKAIKEAMGVI